MQGRALICAGPCCGRQVETSPLTSNAEGESEIKQDTGASAERKGAVVVKGEYEDGAILREAYETN